MGSFLTFMFAIQYFPFLVVAIGSPTSTHPPSNIDWESLDNLFEIPSPEIHESSSPLQHEHQQDRQEKNDSQIQLTPIQKSKKRKKIRYADTLLKACQEYKKNMQADPEYAKRRRAQTKAASQRYREKFKKVLSPEELEERRLKINQAHRLSYHNRKIRNLQTEGQYAVILPKAKQEHIIKMRDDPEYAKRHKAKTNAASQRHRDKLKTVLSPKELEERRLKINQAHRLSYHNSKQQ